MVKRYVFSWYAVCFYAALIIVSSVIPLELPLSREVDFFDKIVHFLIYLLLSSMILNTSLMNRLKHCRLRSFLGAFILGLIIECVQFFLPFRNFELADILVNCLGAFAGMFLRIVR